MNKPDTHTANRIILAVLMIAMGALLWILVGEAISHRWGATITGKLWLSLVLGSAMLADTLYKRWSNKKKRSSNT